ncbi:MAG TPA: hypothetical protein VG742_13310 [Dongiaceae bacterium]|nr:hypothetical protein [Dongiaceae bacterium]
MNNPPNKNAAGGKPSGLNARLPALSELRHIGFSKDALIMALKMYFATTKHSLPPGTVESCTFTTEPDLIVTLGIRNDTSPQPAKINIQAPTIAAAMITYCSKVKVPLPRTGEKSLKVIGDQLNLVVKVHAEQTKMFKVDGSE